MCEKEVIFDLIFDLVVDPVLLPVDPDPQVGVVDGGDEVGVLQLLSCTFRCLV